ncbi:MAG: hypothetical protein AB7N70_15730 [Dehalococcoidia bacterium]
MAQDREYCDRPTPAVLSGVQTARRGKIVTREAIAGRNQNTMRHRYSILKIALAVTVGFALPTAANSAEQIGYNGFGDIRVGMSIWKLLVVLGQNTTVESIESGCTNVYRTTSDDIIYMIVEDALARVEIRTPNLPTISGITIGATEQDILAAYPDRVEISDHEYQEGHYLTVYSSDRKSAVVFDTDGTHVRSFRIGRLPEALYIEGCS